MAPTGISPFAYTVMIYSNQIRENCAATVKCQFIILLIQRGSDWHHNTHNTIITHGTLVGAKIIEALDNRPSRCNTVKFGQEWVTICYEKYGMEMLIGVLVPEKSCEWNKLKWSLLVQVQVFYFSKDTIRYISIACTYNLTHFSVSNEVANREAKLIELLATYIT